ncbi:hypothetical protein EQV96_03535 [Pseudomonas sp. TMW22080]|nr:hypothetical protein [Pseudomonas sp. TMW22080]
MDCGSGLARNAGHAGYLENRGDAIASKPAPTGLAAFTKRILGAVTPPAHAIWPALQPPAGCLRSTIWPAR